MEEEVSNNGGPWRARMNSRAPRQKEKKKIKPDSVDHDNAIKSSLSASKQLSVHERGATSGAALCSNFVTILIVSVGAVNWNPCLAGPLPKPPWSPTVQRLVLRKCDRSTVLLTRANVRALPFGAQITFTGDAQTSASRCVSSCLTLTFITISVRPPARRGAQI